MKKTPKKILIFFLALVIGTAFININLCNARVLDSDTHNGICVIKCVGAPSVTFSLLVDLGLALILINFLLIPNFQIHPVRLAKNPKFSDWSAKPRSRPPKISF